MIYALVFLGLIFVSIGDIALALRPAQNQGLVAAATAPMPAPTGSPTGRPITIGRNLAFYEAVSILYIDGNPGYIGAIDKKKLSFPGWYVELEPWQSYATGSEVVSWGPADLETPDGVAYGLSTAGLSYGLATLTPLIPTAGLAENGEVVSPVSGTETPIPPGPDIPDGAPVILFPAP